MLGGRLDGPTAHWSDDPLVRKPIGPTAQWSKNPLVQRPIGPKTHWSKDPLVRKSVIGPKTIGPKKCVIGPKKCHWSENSGSKRQGFKKNFRYSVRYE